MDDDFATSILLALEQETKGLLGEIIGGAST